jgi:ferritin
MNAQIRDELLSAYGYLDLSAACAAEHLKGAALWLRKQWDEEVGHALKLIDYVVDRGNRVELLTLDPPRFEFTSLTAVFEKVLSDEQRVSAAIHALYAKAVAEEDFAAQVFLQWYVTEQVEEENSAQAIVDTLRLVGDKGTALLMVDRQLAARA